MPEPDCRCVCLQDTCLLAQCPDKLLGLRCEIAGAQRDDVEHLGCRELDEGRQVDLCQQQRLCKAIPMPSRRHYMEHATWRGHYNFWLAIAIEINLRHAAA